MAHVEVADAAYLLDDGTPLFSDLTLRVGSGAKAALIGPNGLGKTTLLRLLSADLPLSSGSRSASGTIAVMPQFVGTGLGPSTVRELLLATSPGHIGRIGAELAASETAIAATPDDPGAQMRYAQAISDWADAGGYLVEAEWDEVLMRAVGLPFAAVADRVLAEFSGGQQKRIVLDALFSGPGEILLLDEPDNFLDVEGKRWLEELIRETQKALLFISHDRALVAAAATSILTLEPGTDGANVWRHGGGFASYAEAREARNERLDEVQRRWDETELQLRKLVQMYKQKAAYNSDMASRYQAAVTRLERFRAQGRPEPAPRIPPVRMRLEGGRTAKRALILGGLAIPGIVDPFDVELWFGDRVALTGPNGSGKSHILAAIADAAVRDAAAVGTEVTSEPVDWTGEIRLGSRVTVGHFVQLHERPDLEGRTLVEVLHRGAGDRSGMTRDQAIHLLGRYGLASRGDIRFDQLSGGQQHGSRSRCSRSPARPCCCWTSRPTTSTSSRWRRSRSPSTPSRGRSWRSRTTAGSRGASIASCTSAMMGASPRRRQLAGAEPATGAGQDAAVALATSSCSAWSSW